MFEMINVFLSKHKMFCIVSGCVGDHLGMCKEVFRHVFWCRRKRFSGRYFGDSECDVPVCFSVPVCAIYRHVFWGWRMRFSASFSALTDAIFWHVIRCRRMRYSCMHFGVGGYDFTARISVPANAAFRQVLWCR